MRKATYHDLRDRYERDARFANAVNMIYGLMEGERITPQEMREMVDMACLKFASLHVEPIFLREQYPDHPLRLR